jgi:FG-GAP-like repeat/Bacterial pre-peptidase C-terminal domain
MNRGNVSGSGTLAPDDNADDAAHVNAEPIIGGGPLAHAFFSLSESEVQSSAPDPAFFPSATGFMINLVYDAAALAAPASFRTGIQHAADILMAALTDHITVNLNIHYSGTGGGAFAGPSGHIYSNFYSTIRSLLVSNASPGDHTFDALPAGSSIQGQSSVTVWAAEEKLYGLNGIGPNDATTSDGSATFATDINPNLLAGVALHELTHALGRIPYGSQPDIFDFFRFTSAGTRLFLNGDTAPAAYFSVDGGNTKLADYGRTSDPSDFLNSGVQGPNDPFNEIYTSNTLQSLTAVDLRQLDALGFHLSSGQSTPDDYADTLTDTSAPFGQVAVNGSNAGALEATGDRDWFQVQLTAGVAYRIDLKGQSSSSGTLNDPYLRVHDASGTLLVQNNDIQSGSNLDSRLTYTPTTSGTFYLEAGAFNDNATGTYTVAVSSATTHWAGSVDIGSHPSGWLPSGTGDFNNDGTSDLVWYNAANGNVDLWELANGSWAASANLGSHPAGWQPSGIGDFDHNGASDILWYNSTSGNAEIWKISNGQWAGSVNLGSHPAGWRPAGVGDFNHDGTADVLWYNSTSGNAEIWKISNGQWAGSGNLGAHPAGWQPAGVGDFNHDGTSDILWYNPTSGNAEIWQLSNGQWASSSNIGNHPAGWQPAGVADFNSDGTSDILWVNPTTGGAEIWQIANGQWAGTANIGNHPAGWQAAGVGDFNHDGTSDILWRNASTGHVEDWLLANG